MRLEDFSFQTGEWTVRHRKLRERLAGCSEWFEFGGSCRAWELLRGGGNFDDHWLGDPAGAYAAATIRKRDPATGVWSIWWIDPRQPSIEPPVRCRFVDGVGTFVGEDNYRGIPILVRFIWSASSDESARWDQAFSPDAGVTWEQNWVMDFTRAS